MKRSTMLILVLGAGLAVAAAAVAAGPGWLRPLLQGKVERYAEQWRQREEYKKRVAERRAAELTAERTWESTPASPCGDFGRGSGPQLCIEHLGPETSRLGSTVPYRVRWRNLPTNAYIRVWSRNAAPAGERWAYMGAQGAISPGPLHGAAGDVRREWDGPSIYCAPADGPMMCDAGEVGRYVLRAAIMTGSDPFWRSFPPRNPVPVKYYANAETRAFRLAGPPRSYAATQAIIPAIHEALPKGALGSDWYVERRMDRLGPWVAEGRNHCAALELDAPLTGSVSVCFPRSRRDANGIALRPSDIFARANARLAPGVLRAEDAKMKASAYAVALTGGRATFSAYPSEKELVRELIPIRTSTTGIIRACCAPRGLPASPMWKSTSPPHRSGTRVPGAGGWWI